MRVKKMKLDFKLKIELQEKSKLCQLKASNATQKCCSQYSVQNQYIKKEKRVHGNDE